MNEKPNKGSTAEEALRDYFISQGFYTLRGVKLIYKGSDVTDLDVFIYARPSSFTRERGIVDIKNKKSPQAFERILWAKGLTAILGFERCFVATTDQRAEVTSFGLKNNVVILDGNFLSRLPKPQSENNGPRLSEEELTTTLEISSVGKLGGDWRGAYEISKSRTISEPDFDGANSALDDIRIAAEITASNPNDEAARRLAYILVSHFLIILDHLSTPLPLLDLEKRRAFFEDGFRYGDRGKQRAEEILTVTSKLATAIGGRYRNFGTTLREEMLTQYSALLVGILAEYFSKTSTLRSILELASTFEKAAFSRVCPKPSELPVENQSVIGLLGDYYKIDRKLLLY